MFILLMKYPAYVSQIVCFTVYDIQGVKTLLYFPHNSKVLDSEAHGLFNKDSFSH